MSFENEPKTDRVPEPPAPVAQKPPAPIAPKPRAPSELVYVRNVSGMRIAIRGVGELLPGERSGLVARSIAVSLGEHTKIEEPEIF